MSFLAALFSCPLSILSSLSLPLCIYLLPPLTLSLSLSLLPTAPAHDLYQICKPIVYMPSFIHSPMTCMATHCHMPVHAATCIYLGNGNYHCVNHTQATSCLSQTHCLDTMYVGSNSLGPTWSSILATGEERGIINNIMNNYSGHCIFKTATSLLL